MTEDRRLHLALDVLHAGIRTLRDDDAEFMADLSVALPSETAEVEAAIVMLARAARHAGGMAEAARKIAEETAARAKRFNDRQDRLRGLIFGAMQTLERSKIEAPDYTIAVRQGNQAVVVTDETAIPEEYWKTERTLSKRSLNDDLKNGVVVPGAELGNGMPVITIRGT